jgi:hypothetical protein
MPIASSFVTSDTTAQANITLNKVPLSPRFTSFNHYLLVQTPPLPIDTNFKNPFELEQHPFNITWNNPTALSHSALRQTINNVFKNVVNLMDYSHTVGRCVRLGSDYIYGKVISIAQCLKTQELSKHLITTCLKAYGMMEKKFSNLPTRSQQVAELNRLSSQQESDPKSQYLLGLLNKCRETAGHLFYKINREDISLRDPYAATEVMQAMTSNLRYQYNRRQCASSQYPKRISSSTDSCL